MFCAGALYMIALYKIIHLLCWVKIWVLLIMSSPAGRYLNCAFSC
ncbi:hypothetical protein T11_2221 [Trichinella zimbabwensis]|uniref:Uncharacterized protein n=1 Tax=Trichinella zimbabwensis TaxID=268475 RepID=A0A0V1GNP1_9BILA|nr:hypothetical protein T11_2221 [Trichinella zimbabwensis]